MADVVSFVPGVGTIAGFVSLGARVAGDAVEGGLKALKKNWKSYAVDAAICATGIGGAAKAVSRAAGVVAKKATREVAEVAAKKVARVTANRATGLAFEKQIATSLSKAGRTVVPNVYKKTPFGKRYIDLDVWKGGKNLGGIECKTGGSRYTASQRAKDAYLYRVQGYRVNVVRNR